MRVTVTSKGRITIPAETRRRLGIRAGTRLEVIVRDENRLEVILLNGSVKDLKGVLPRPRRAVSLKQMEEAIVKGALRAMRKPEARMRKTSARERKLGRMAAEGSLLQGRGGRIRPFQAPGVGGLSKQIRKDRR